MWKKTTDRVLAALNRADEIGGEVRDYLQDRVLVHPRYIAARRRLAGVLGRSYESKPDVLRGLETAARIRAETAAVTAVGKPRANRPLGDGSIKAQVYGTRSCPWSGRVITLLERSKVDFDFIDLEEPEHEGMLARLLDETKQHTIPYVFLRGQFIGGFNALSEIERLGQLEFALMSTEERAYAPAHLRAIQIVARPNTDEVAPAELDPLRDALSAHRE